MNPDLQDLIRELQLTPHPEGGYFRETYRAAPIDAAYRSHREHPLFRLCASA